MKRSRLSRKGSGVRKTRMKKYFATEHQRKIMLSPNDIDMLWFSLESHKASLIKGKDYRGKHGRIEHAKRLQEKLEMV